MNETLSTIAKRYSCRSFKDQVVEKEKLEAIALAAVQSPSAVNAQPWEVIVITDKTLIDELDEEAMNVLAKAEDQATYERMMSRGGKLFYNAPVMYVIVQKPGKDLDTGIVSENIALAATSLGLGNVICGMARIPFSTEKGETFKERMGIPEGFEFGMSVLVGYSNEEGMPHVPDISKIHYIK